MTEYVTFSVSGKGRFPFDMLRHDQCYPNDTHNIDVVDQYRTIRCCMTANTPMQGPTEARWASFGWVVTDIRRCPANAN